MRALYDPDGAPPPEVFDRRRAVRLHQRDDGAGEIRGTLTPECLAAVQAVLHPLAAPVPSNDAAVDAEGHPVGVVGPDGGVPDPRTGAQRLHDALLDAAMRLLGSGTLPDAGGTPVSIAVTMTVHELRRGAGLTTTEYGTTVPVSRLLDLAAEADWLPTLLRPTSGALDYGTARRCAPPAMARALRARDGGCTFPGCTRPAAWTERHHIVEHRRGGSTSLDNLTLVCRYHHRAFTRHGWQVVMRDGRPWWIPPVDIDPHRRPRRSTHWDTPVP